MGSKFNIVAFCMLITIPNVNYNAKCFKSFILIGTLK